VSTLWGVENCPFPLTKAVAVNTERSNESVGKESSHEKCENKTKTKEAGTGHACTEDA